MGAIHAFAKRITTALTVAIVGVSASVWQCPIGMASSAEPLERAVLSGVDAVPTYIWPCQNAPRSIVVGLHGGCLHGQAYGPLAHELAQRGHMFVSFDMRGYGKWHHRGWGSPLDQTFNYKKTMTDAVALVQQLRYEYRGVPIYFMGESLGGNMALYMGAHYPGLSDGVIVVSPCCTPKFMFEPAMLTDAFRVTTNPGGRINMIPYETGRLGDKDQVNEHLKDPLSRDHQTFPEMMASMSLNFRGKWFAKQIPSNTPALVVVGAQDKLCSEKGTARMFKDLACTRKQMVVLPQCGHLIVETSTFDPQVPELISHWMDEMNPPPAPHIEASADPVEPSLLTSQTAGH